MSPDSSPRELHAVFAHLQGMLLSDHDATTAVAHLARTAHQMFPTSAGAGVSLLGADGTRISTAATTPAALLARARAQGRRVAEVAAEVLDAA